MQYRISSPSIDTISVIAPSKTHTFKLDTSIDMSPLITEVAEIFEEIEVNSEEVDTLIKSGERDAPAFKALLNYINKIFSIHKEVFKQISSQE